MSLEEYLGQWGKGINPLEIVYRETFLDKIKNLLDQQSLLVAILVIVLLSIVSIATLKLIKPGLTDRTDEDTTG